MIVMVLGVLQHPSEFRGEGVGVDLRRGPWVRLLNFLIFIPYCLTYYVFHVCFIMLMNSTPGAPSSTWHAEALPWGGEGRA